ncbi:dTDP-4-dehydrorhamnose 3,5-epimerase [Polaribacter vadi]|uniref:dTDP-4-dehydrorhamnose 3,5-epimerase n=1 Tax=Polaribacter TaxID=52959 RepID=UPI001C091E0A|nr:MULTISPECIES: dTDP-4-dehydrorhamnose 3,5-epimerase [Polaribacter]MBU3010932.1 dTDP-4-dehydrorhamnose 3,5-epimerase [Polaribacter vadi]MDO6740744.1 dTDP-4-dehydrorhamnose 3,5-epimerase [Polaribacter sp. 1_MG-2023]
MKVIETKLKGCYVIEPEIFQDSRGVFFESFNKKKFKEKTGLEIDFVQDNISISNKGVIRGLHIQKGEFAQTKLIKVIKGKVLDVVVDVRKESTTFGQSFSCILSEENLKQLFVPRGFLHGFSVLEDNTIVSYKCDNYYNKEAEDGVVYNDSDLNIDWRLKGEEVVTSEKDEKLKSFVKYKSFFGTIV